MDDKRLLEVYMEGFKDELDSAKEAQHDEHLAVIAYNLGRLHAALGDDMRCFDELSEEEILKLIKG